MLNASSLKRKIEKPYRVYVGLVSTGYLDATSISKVINDGIIFCGLRPRLEGLKPSASCLVRPSLICAGPKRSLNVYTNPEIVRATLTQLFENSRLSRITVAEEALPGLSTARMLHRAHGGSETFRSRGYFELEHLFPGRVRLLALEEAEKCRYQLGKGALLSAADRAAAQGEGLSADVNESVPREIWRKRLSNEIIAPAVFRGADLKIYCPKIKTDLTSDNFSGAIRQSGGHGYLGPLGDHKICDNLEICHPDLVIGDGIVAGVGGDRTAQKGYELGVVLVANNALAHDWVAARILNLDPMKIKHLRIAMERGWGPSSFSQIELGGAEAEGIQQLGEKTRLWNLGCTRLEEFRAEFENDNPGHPFPLEILSGSPHEQSGVHGAFLEWLHRGYGGPSQRSRMAKWPPATVCLGSFDDLPKKTTVYALGNQAVSRLSRFIGSERQLFASKGIAISWAQFKNERRHLVIRVPNRAGGLPPTPAQIGRAFFAGSLGKVTTRGYSALALLDTMLSAMRLKWRSAALQNQQVHLTSRLPQNRWWALTNASELLEE